MIDFIAENLSEIENCILTIDIKHSYIFEDNQLKKGVFVSKIDTNHLHVENNTKNDIYFIQNDNCVMINYFGGQCDYVIFNNFNFYFIDVKVAKDNYANHRKKAYLQIKNTFKYYSEKLNLSPNYVLHGLVCFPSNRRIIKPSESTKRKEFKQKYKIDLKVGNYILFE